MEVTREQEEEKPLKQKNIEEYNNEFMPNFEQ
jgi:hypothetical protein